MNKELFEKFAKERRIENRHGDDNNNYYDIRYGFLKACEIKDKEIQELKAKNEKLKKCVVWYKENEIVSLDKYIEASNCGQFKYATNLKANETLKEIEESK